jgi:hypothetical protein
MLLVVFGAGASHDSAPSYPVANDPVQLLSVKESRPPLADDLFQDRGLFAHALTSFPKCQLLVPYLRHLSKTETLEHVLAGYVTQAEKFPERKKQIMAVRYYLAYVIKVCEQEWSNVHKGVTNYRTLLDQIENWRYQKNEKVCFVTFNYDTMLETACDDFGLHFSSHNDYISNKHYKLFKLHGSISWGRFVETHIESLQNGDYWAVAKELTERARELQLSPTWTHISMQPPPLLPGNLAIAPAIAIPIENKSEFECPVEHIQALTKCLPEVTKMLTIGWRATEQHFLALLTKYLPHPEHLMVVAKDQPEAWDIGKRLQPGRLDIHAATSGFTGTILTREIEPFLWI